MPKTEPFYITKFALTKGIFLAEGVRVGSMVRVQGAYPWQQTTFHKGDFHEDPNAALRRAWQMRDSKVASLRAEADRVATMEFDVPQE